MHDLSNPPKLRDDLVEELWGQTLGAIRWLTAIPAATQNEKALSALIGTADNRPQKVTRKALELLKASGLAGIDYQTRCRLTEESNEAGQPIIPGV